MFLSVRSLLISCSLLTAVRQNGKFRTFFFGGGKKILLGSVNDFVYIKATAGQSEE